MGPNIPGGALQLNIHQSGSENCRSHPIYSLVFPCIPHQSGGYFMAILWLPPFYKYILFICGRNICGWKHPAAFPNSPAPAGLRLQGGIPNHQQNHWGQPYLGISLHQWLSWPVRKASAGGLPLPLSPLAAEIFSGLRKSAQNFK